MKFALVLCAILGLASSHALNGATPTDASFQARLDVDVKQLVKPSEPGLAVCVASDGNVSLTARGLADIERGVPMTVDTGGFVGSENAPLSAGQVRRKTTLANGKAPSGVHEFSTRLFQASRCGTSTARCRRSRP